MKEFWTVGHIADEAGVKVHIIRHWLATRHVKPIGTAGHANVYGPDVVERFKAERNPPDKAGPTLPTSASA